jgi:hypothetical protein
MASTETVTVLTPDGKIKSEWVSFLQSTKSTISQTPATSSDTGGLQCVNAQLFGLTFDTSANSTRFPHDNFTPAHAHGSSVVLGLRQDAKTPSDVSLLQILSAIGIAKDDGGPWDSGSTVDRVITAISSSAGIAFQTDASDARSAMWLTPGQTQRADTAVVLALVTSDSSFLNTVANEVLGQYFPGFTGTKVGSFGEPKLFIQRTDLGVASDSTWDLATSFKIAFRFTVEGLWFWLAWDPVGVSLAVTPSLAQLSSNGFWDKAESFNSPALNRTIASPLNDVTDVNLLSFLAGVDAQNNVHWKVNLAWQLGNADKPVQVFLAYESLSSTFSGGILLANFYPDKLSAGFRPGIDLEQPPGTAAPPEGVDLVHLFSSSDATSLPIGLPTTITYGELDFHKTNPSIGRTQSTFFIKATLASPSTPQNAVPWPFEWKDVDLELAKGEYFLCSLASSFIVNDTTGRGIRSAVLDAAVSYDGASKAWYLDGSIVDLSGALLVGFFEDGYQSQLVEVLGKLAIQSLFVTYTYTQGQASSFCMTGTIIIDSISLRLFYQYASSIAGTNTAAHQTLPEDGPQPQPVPPKKDGTPQADWAFECDLDAAEPGATVGTLVEALSDDLAGVLPSFVSKINIPQAGGRDPVRVRVSKMADGSLAFLLRLVIGSLSLTYLQLAHKSSTDKSPTTKRLLRIACDSLPTLPDIPLVGKVPQPFDALQYYWVNDAGGLLDTEVAMLNGPTLSSNDASTGPTGSPLLDADEKLLYKVETGPAKDDKTGKGGESDPVVVIQPGHHFVVVHNGEVILDHNFVAASEKTNSPPSPPKNASKRNMAVVKATAQPDQPTDASKPAKGALSFKFGPLSVTAVTFHYKERNTGTSTEKFLYVTVDATFAMGPLSFSLLGFSIGLGLAQITLDSLSTLSPSNVQQVLITLQGMALDLSKPPLLLAGMFEHTKTDDSESFRGGVGIGMPPYTFVGLGEYKIMESLKSVFIYAKLDGREYPCAFPSSLLTSNVC